MNRRTNLLASTIVFALLMVFGLMFLTGLPTQAAGESTLMVKTLGDADNGDCGVITCTLRDAILAANGSAGTDTIHFDLAANTTITLGSQLPVITDTLIIDGSTAVSLTVSGDNKYRVFEIGSGTTVTMTDMTIMAGKAVSGTSCPDACGAGILNGGQLGLDRMIFSNNEAYLGGGLYNRAGAALTAVLSEFSVNTANNGAGIYHESSDKLLVERSVFSGNNGLNSGGGIFILAGTITIDRDHFEDNTANWGGGIFLSGGTMDADQSTFTTNTVTRGGGAFYSADRVKLSGSSMTGNAANLGGAIYNGSSGRMDSSDNSLTSNTAIAGGGGVYVATNGVMTMTQAVLMHNSATDGGAIDNWGTTRVNVSTIYSNTATNGGGVYIGTTGWMEGTNVTIEDNSAGISGGGLYNWGKLTLDRNTVNSNRASTAGGVGGGIYVLPSGQLTMTNSTVSSNSALWGGGVTNNGLSRIINSTLGDNLATYGGGLRNDSTGQLYFSNSIIADSQVGVDCSNVGTIVTNIHNLVETGNCSALFSDDPKLEPLADNGGETLTQAIPIDSPATNHGDNATCEAKDQRGVSRPQDGACDIGAYEYSGGMSVYLPLVIKK
jgi:CSLREA domain-containing protein